MYSVELFLSWFFFLFLTNEENMIKSVMQAVGYCFAIIEHEHDAKKAKDLIYRRILDLKKELGL